jgi:hypothetical protein
VLAAGEVQCDFASLAGGNYPAGEHAGALIAGLSFQLEHLHAGVVVVQNLSLRRLPD